MNQNQASVVTQVFEPRKVSEQDAAAYREFQLTDVEVAALTRPTPAVD